MRAIVVTAIGGSGARGAGRAGARRPARPPPRAGRGGRCQLPRRVERNGTYPTVPPFTAGAEGAGRVLKVGDGVTEFAPGDRVGWNTAQGSYAERVLVPAGNAVPVSDAVSSELAAAVYLQGLTAHYLATSTYPVRAGDVTVVHAAAGGVGLLLTQMVKLLGGRVIATTSTDEKAALARGAGADETIPYEGFADRVRELTDGEGAAVVYDGVGQATFDESLAALRRRGTMVLYGAASGPVAPVRPDPPAEPRVAVPDAAVAAALHRRSHGAPVSLGGRVGWIAAGQLDVRIGGRSPSRTPAAPRNNLQARRTAGKLLLLP